MQFYESIMKNYLLVVCIHTNKSPKYESEVFSSDYLNQNCFVCSYASPLKIFSLLFIYLQQPKLILRGKHRFLSWNWGRYPCRWKFVCEVSYFVIHHRKILNTDLPNFIHFVVLQIHWNIIAYEFLDVSSRKRIINSVQITECH